MTLFIYLKRFIQLKVCLVLLGCLTAGLPLYAQPETSQVKPLSVGDTVPDITLHNIVHYKDTFAKLSDFRGKLVIIDFWGTYCGSCIAALPKIDMIQKKFKDRIQVFTVTEFDTKEKVLNTLQKYRSIKSKNLKLPIILSGDKLSQYFPHQLLSHVVWIDDNGIVKAITGTEYVNAKNIQKILNHESVNWPVKKDVLGFDYSRSFLQFMNGNIENPSSIYYSALTSHITGVDATTKKIIDSIHQTITWNYFNNSLDELCIGAVTGSIPGYVNPKHLVLEVKDPARYFFDKNEDYYAKWAVKNTYCYSVTLPLGISKKERKTFIRKDLLHWFDLLGITVSREQRLMKCLVLIHINRKAERLKSKGGKYYYGLEDTGKIKRLNNAGLSNLIWKLNRDTPHIPWVYNETGLPKDMKVDIELNISSFENIPLLRKELKKYGLDLRPAMREMDMYVIKEGDHK